MSPLGVRPGHKTRGTGTQPPEVLCVARPRSPAGRGIREVPKGQDQVAFWDTRGQWTFSSSEELK